MARFDVIDATRLGYGKIKLPFVVDLPDEYYYHFKESDRNFVILVEALLQFKDFNDKEKENFEEQVKVIQSIMEPPIKEKLKEDDAVAISTKEISW